MTTNKPGIKIYEPSEKGVTAMRKASFRNTGLNRYVRLSDYEALRAECEKLRKAIRRLCNIYVVDDYCSGDIREEQLSRAVERATDAAMQGGIHE